MNQSEAKQAAMAQAQAAAGIGLAAPNQVSSPQVGCGAEAPQDFMPNMPQMPASLGSPRGPRTCEYTATGFPLGDVGGRCQQLAAIEAHLQMMKDTQEAAGVVMPAEAGEQVATATDTATVEVEIAADKGVEAPVPPPPPMGAPMDAPMGFPHMLPPHAAAAFMPPMSTHRSSPISSRIAETAMEREETARRLAEHRQMLLAGQATPEPLQ